MADEDTKPKTEPGQVINLVVKDQANNEVHFKVKTKTRLEKVIVAYCNKKGMDTSAVRFLFDGSRVNPSATPEELGMEDGDCLDVVMEQVGGHMVL